MFAITILLAIVGLIGTDIFAPSLPAIAAHFQVPMNHVQLTISLFLFGFAFSQLFYGPVSDRIGRKPPLILGIGFFTLGSIISLSAPSFMWLCIGRVIQGMGAGGGLSLTRVVLRDCYQGSTLAIKSSQLAIFVSMTPAVAPLVGGVMQQYLGFRASFIFMLLYGVLLLLLLCTRYPETNQNKDKSLTVYNTLVDYGHILKNLNFMRYVFITGMAFAAIILYTNIVPFIVQQQLKFSATSNGLILLIAALGLCAGALINSRIVMRVTPKRVLHLGVIILTVSGLLFMIVDSLWGASLFSLVPLLFLATMSSGFIFPNAVALAFSQVTANIGIAGAVYGTVQILLSALLNFLLNLIPVQGQFVLGSFYLVMGGLALLLYHYQSEQKAQQVVVERNFDYDLSHEAI